MCQGRSVFPLTSAFIENVGSFCTLGTRGFAPPPFSCLMLRPCWSRQSGFKDSEVKRVLSPSCTLAHLWKSGAENDSCPGRSNEDWQPYQQCQVRTREIERDVPVHDGAFHASSVWVMPAPAQQQYVT